MPDAFASYHRSDAPVDRSTLHAQPCPMPPFAPRLSFMSRTGYFIAGLLVAAPPLVLILAVGLTRTKPANEIYGYVAMFLFIAISTGTAFAVKSAVHRRYHRRLREYHQATGITILCRVHAPVAGWDFGDGLLILQADGAVILGTQATIVIPAAAVNHAGWKIQNAAGESKVTIQLDSPGPQKFALRLLHAYDDNGPCPRAETMTQFMMWYRQLERTDTKRPRP